MTTFGLVHGAWHGAWCWERLIPELEARGHSAKAMDLPGDDPAATFADYADAAMEAVDGIDDLVLVGHSLGGCTLPFVAERRSVRLLVYLCAVVPGTKRTWGATDEPRFAAPGVFEGLTGDANRCQTWSRGSTGGMYSDLRSEDVAWAEPLLRRQCWGIWDSFEPFEDLAGSQSAVVIARADPMVLPEWSRWAAASRLGGVTPSEIDGGHFPMITRPGELADLLVSLLDPARRG